MVLESCMLSRGQPIVLQQLALFFILAAVYFSVHGYIGRGLQWDPLPMYPGIYGQVRGNHQSGSPHTKIKGLFTLN